MTWEERLIKAEKVGYFTDEDEALSGNYETCAVGERHHIGIPNFGTELYRLGMLFNIAVIHGNIALAWEIYRDIQTAQVEA